MRNCAVALYLFGLLAAAFGSPTAAWAQSSSVPTGALESAIGKVANVTGSATIEHSSAVIVQANISDGVLPAKVGDFVYRGDKIQTAVGGTIGLVFTDGTAFNLSSNAQMVLNEFVYDPKSSSNSTFFSLAKGNFTFVAGQVAKTGNMRFDTPVATMGIRGTTPHVEVLNDGSVRFSTLVEEGTLPPATPRDPRNGPTAPELKKDPFKEQLKLDLRICRGC